MPSSSSSEWDGEVLNLHADDMLEVDGKLLPPGHTSRLVVRATNWVRNLDVCKTRDVREHQVMKELWMKTDPASYTTMGERA